jgi:hypothetical protein
MKLDLKKGEGRLSRRPSNLRATWIHWAKAPLPLMRSILLRRRREQGFNLPLPFLKIKKSTFKERMV